MFSTGDVADEELTTHYYSDDVTTATPDYDYTFTFDYYFVTQSTAVFTVFTVLTVLSVPPQYLMFSVSPAAADLDEVRNKVSPSTCQ